MASFFVNKKVRETNQGIERVEEQKEGEPEESVEVGGDESEDSDTEREIPDGEEDEEEGEEHEKEDEENEEEGEEEVNIQRQREEQPEGQKVDPCGSSTAPSVTRPITMEFHYPLACTSGMAKKKFRERTLRGNPDTLYADYSQKGRKVEKTNLIFYTTLIKEWKSIICAHYNHVVIDVQSKGDKLTICHDENLDTGNPILTIHCYNTGTVLVQSNEASLDAFEKIFPQLKTSVKSKRDETHVNNTNSVESPENSPPSTSDHQLTEKRADERDQPQTAAEESSSSITTKLTNDFSELKLK